MVMTAQQLKEKLEREKTQKEIQDQFALIGLGEERKKKFANYKDRQAAAGEASYADYQKEYEKHHQNYQEHFKRFKDNSFNSTQTWMSAQIAMTHLCYMHLLQQQAWRQKYTSKVWNALKSSIGIGIVWLGHKWQARFAPPPNGPVNLPEMKCTLKIDSDKKTGLPTITMDQTLGKKSLKDFLEKADGLKDVAQFYDQTKEYFDRSLAIWLEKHGYKLDPANNTVQPIAPPLAPFSEKVFKSLDKQDPFAAYLKTEMPKMKVNAELVEENERLDPKP